MRLPRAWARAALRAAVPGLDVGQPRVLEPDAHLQGRVHPIPRWTSLLSASGSRLKSLCLFVTCQHEQQGTLSHFGLISRVFLQSYNVEVHPVVMDYMPSLLC